MPSASFAIPSYLPALSVAALVMIVGCAKTETATVVDAGEAEGEVISETATTPEQSEQLRPAIRERPLGGVASRGAAPMAVKAGTPPLVYLVESAQMVQVVDETAGVIIAESPVRRQSILRVDERNGVIAGKDQLFAGPLPAGRRYGIYVVPDGENVSRAGRYMPRPTREPKPAPPPAAAR
jgi:hypothetical protein